MKRTVLSIMAALLVSASATAQNYQQSRYYNPRTGRLDYNQRPEAPRYGSPRHNGRSTDAYFGLRIGPSFSFVSSDDSKLDGGNWKTGLNVGAVAGIPLSYYNPLYLEVGLSYTEKGGQKNLESGKKMTYSLNYLEIPIVLKYKYNVTPSFSIQPELGGYFAVGVSGKTKNFQEREAVNSFSDTMFKRTDGGLRFGCGAAYDMFYCELVYDLGLANICHDTFDTSRNGNLQLNVGVNF